MQNGMNEKDPPPPQVQQLLRDRERLQKEKAESRQLYYALLELSNDMIYIVDRDCRYIFVNAAAAGLVDKVPEDMVGRNISEFAPPDVARYISDHIEKVFKTGEVFVDEAPFLLPPKQLWADVRMVPVKSPSLEVVSVICVTRDLTDQKLAENALRESEERFRQIIAQMPYPVVVCAIDGTAVMVNSALCTILKIPSPDMIVGKINILHNPYIKKIGVEIDIQKIMQGEHVFLPEVQITQDWIETESVAEVKQSLTLEVSIFPVYLQPGEIFQIVIIFKDITERKQAELAIKKNEKKMRTQYKSFPVPTYTWQKLDNDFILVDYNDAAYHFTAGIVTKLLGKRVSDVFGHDPKVIREMSRCLNEKTIVKMESSYVFPVSKSEKQLNATYVFVEPDIVMVHTEDVTEKQKLEQEIRRAEHLESIGLLAGGIAHDFNNLLAGIFGYIGLAREYGKNNDNVKECLDKAMLVFGQTKALTQQLLTFSKGGSPVRKLASIAELLRDMSAFVLAGADVKPEYVIPEDLWACEVDTGQLSEVINNILINAQQAMPDGGIITIMAENSTVREQQALSLKAGSYVKISIKDHGVGIPQEHLSKVFDPFFSTKQAGSGLGLPVAYSIIKKHGGHIEISSTVGLGTTVEIYLPASLESLLHPARQTAEMHRGQGRILLMDDEEFLLDALRKIISSLGYGVETVRNGQEAVNLFRKSQQSGVPFDAVILDLTIPGGMGGKQAMLEMRKIDPGLRAIATSGYSEDPVIADPRAFGFRGALRKPYSIDELGDVLYKVLSEP
jgi:PAS domain S-box-containing protein